MCNFPFKWITYSNFSAKFITAFIWLASSNSERHPPTSIICFPRPTVIFVWKYVGSTFYRQPGLYREINFCELWMGGGWRVGWWLTDCDHILWDVEQIPRIDNHHSIANTSLRCVAEPPRLQLLCKFTILPLYATVESGSEVSNHNEIRWHCWISL